MPEEVLKVEVVVTSVVKILIPLQITRIYNADPTFKFLNFACMLLTIAGF